MTQKCKPENEEDEVSVRVVAEIFPPLSMVPLLLLLQLTITITTTATNINFIFRGIIPHCDRTASYFAFALHYIFRTRSRT